MKNQIPENILKNIKRFNAVEIKYCMETDGDFVDSTVINSFETLAELEAECLEFDVMEDAPAYKTYATVYLHYTPESNTTEVRPVCDCIVYKDAEMIALGLLLLIATANEIKINQVEGA